MDVLASTKALGVVGPTTPLAPFATWTPPWSQNRGLQSGAFGGNEVMGQVSVYSDQPGTVQIFQSDDPANPQMTMLAGDGAVIVPFKLAILRAVITQAFWAAVVTNGGTQQTIFEAVVTQSQNLDMAVLLELRKLRFDINSVSGIKQTADDQPAGTFD